MVFSYYSDSAQNSMIEATQAYGIEEPSETELQVKVFVATSSLSHTQLNILIRKAKYKQQGTQAYIPKSQLVFFKGR